MRLAGQTVAVILTEEGRQVLSLAAIDLHEDPRVLFSVEESEDLGLWVRLSREDRMHFFLLRWDYILGIDLPSGPYKPFGLKSIG
jgi:hypothetical protein